MSGAICTPAAAKSGSSPGANQSSITHWVKGSVFTIARSSSPIRLASACMSASSVAGTIRSTIVCGKAQCAAIQSDASPAAASTASRKCAPFRGRLSQERIVMPSARRFSPSARTAIARLPGR